MAQVPDQEKASPLGEIETAHSALLRSLTLISRRAAWQQHPVILAPTSFYLQDQRSPFCLTTVPLFAAVSYTLPSDLNSHMTNALPSLGDTLRVNKVSFFGLSTVLVVSLSCKPYTWWEKNWCKPGIRWDLVSKTPDQNQKINNSKQTNKQTKTTKQPRNN